MPNKALTSKKRTFKKYNVALTAEVHSSYLMLSGFCGLKIKLTLIIKIQSVEFIVGVSPEKQK